MERYRVLVVEDDTVVALDVVEGLRSLGYEVPDAVPSGELVSKKLRDFRPHVVVMDVRLSGNMDGIAAAEEIVRLYGTPVVFLSGHSDRAILERALPLSSSFLIKPFDEHMIDTAIKQAIACAETQVGLV